MGNEILNRQAGHWENTFSNRSEMYGTKPSIAALKAVETFKKSGIKNIIELGAGQGRDTIFFAKEGFKVFALDYTLSGINSIKSKAESLGLAHLIKTKQSDVRKKLPFEDENFDGCFSHMLYCMAITTDELKNLSEEILRILKPGAINIYTARNTEDGDYKKGICRGEDLYEVGGFIVHFFSKKKIEKLSNGFKIHSIDKFEEGKFPRKLFSVTLEKKIYK